MLDLHDCQTVEFPCAQERTLQYIFVLLVGRQTKTALLIISVSLKKIGEMNVACMWLNWAVKNLLWRTVTVVPIYLQCGQWKNSVVICFNHYIYTWYLTIYWYSISWCIIFVMKNLTLLLWFSYCSEFFLKMRRKKEKKEMYNYIF